MSSVSEPSGPPRLAWGMWKRFLLAGTLIVFLTAAGTATAVLLQVKDVVSAFTRFNKPISGVSSVLDDVPAGDPQTILVLGSDRRWGDQKAGIRPRSDTIMLVRLDPKEGATAVLNIPRDLKVQYHREDGTTYNDKINAAYSIGGPKATVAKVKQVMGGNFPITHVVNINFGAFTRAVNRLGCFYVDVDRRYFNDNHPPVASPTNYATIALSSTSWVTWSVPGTVDEGLARFFGLNDFFVPCGALVPREACASMNSWRTLRRFSGVIVTNSSPRSARNFTRRSGSREASYVSLSSRRTAALERMSVSV